jgi:hypothetical protein
MEIRNIAQATALVALMAGCATTTSVPKERIAASEAAVRTAEQIKQMAPATPEADHHLKLAREELRAAHAELDEGNDRRAEMLFIRARTDAELAQSLALSNKAEREKRDMLSELEKVKSVQTTTTKKVEIKKESTEQATAGEATPDIPSDEHAEHMKREIDD